jgi:EAL domain-containing protein (putative c-di-GMP-specific phosphodiesterase class I)/GGDEF domain-containing protein
VILRFGLVVCAILIGLVNPLSPARAQAPDTPEQSPEQAVEITRFQIAVNESRSNMMADPTIALEAAERAERIVGQDFRDGQGNTEMATAWWLQAEALTRLARPDEAHPIAQRALDRLETENQSSKLFADILLSLGRTSKTLGEHGQALENYQRAYEVYLELGETRSQSIILQSIGSLYNDARQHQRAADYYADAIARYQDPSLDLSAFNNIANVYTEIGRQEEAIEYFSRARTIAQEMGSTMLEARILNNTASMYVIFEDFVAAEASVERAFEVAGDVSGAEWSRFMWGVRAQSVAGQGRYAEARGYIERTFDGVDLTTTSQHFTKFHGAATDIYEALGQWQNALPHLRAFKRLEDESHEFSGSANTALVGAQFDFAEQELQIEQMRIQSLEQDLQLSQVRSRQSILAVVGLLVITILVLIGVYMRHRAAKQRAGDLERALFFDTETGLPSRQGLVRQVTQRARKRDDKVAVIALQIERHSHLEGVLGFTKFAQLQVAMARRIERNTRDVVVSLISSGVLGVMINTDNEAGILSEARRMQRYLGDPIRLDDVDIDVNVTAGFAVHPDSETCVKNSMIAVQQAEAANVPCGGFDAEEYGDPSENLTLMSRMLAATQNGDMQLHYQPKLHLRTGVFGAAEALCRWTDSERGVIPPDEFIPQAEETGHIREFTEWTIARTVSDQRLFQEAGFDLKLAVNISGGLLADDSFSSIAMGIVRQSTGRISFEVTETAMINDPDRAMANLRRWSDAGIDIAIDDYGSGLSSLAYLKTMPSKELKLDRVFITNIANSKRDRMLVKSTVDLAHNLGLELTAEGVETNEGLALLKLMGCDWGQGWALSKALPVPELIDFLHSMQADDTQSLSAPPALRRVDPS